MAEMKRIIVIEFNSREIPQVFSFDNVAKADAAFDRLATTIPWRMTKWECQFGSTELIECQRVDNSTHTRFQK